MTRLWKLDMDVINQEIAKLCSLSSKWCDDNFMGESAIDCLHINIEFQKKINQIAWCYIIWQKRVDFKKLAACPFISSGSHNSPPKKYDPGADRSRWRIVAPETGFDNVSSRVSYLRSKTQERT